MVRVLPLAYMDFSEDLIKYQSNVMPAMLDDLAQTLGVTPRSLISIGIGWMPLEASWVFPERDNEGKIVGLIRRFKDGKKFSVTGGKRGLTYAINPDFRGNPKEYTPGSQNWTRCSQEFPCPICERHDWCLISSENPADPQAVICGRTAEGATQVLGDSGYLHIRKESGRMSSVSAGVLATSSLPILVVEGQSDTAAASDLGYVAVGKPSASGGTVHLAEILIGRDVVVLGENDAGPGRLGMEKTFQALKSKASAVRKLLPPDGIKDLRAWVRAGLTAEMLQEAIRNNGVTESAADLLESTAPMDIAERWLKERHWLEGMPILRMYAGYYYRYDGVKYAQVDAKTLIRGDLYAFLKGKTQRRFNSKGEMSVEPYEAATHKVNDILDTLTMTCPVYEDAPCWLDQEDRVCSKDAITFANGVLTLPDQILIPSTPRFFSMTATPYAWNPTALCPTWLKFLAEALSHDTERIALLQEWFGYNSVADTSQEKLMFFVGRPGAGKGTVIEALRAVLGSAQVASTSFDTLVSDFGLQPLLGKLAAILPDAHITRRGDPAKALQVLKEISGRDSIGINRKNKEFLSDHKLSCRFTISVNSMPDLPDHERSLDRRLLLLHFGESFAGREDTSLKERIIAEAPGIAVWAIQGLLRLRQHGFTQPKSSVPVIEEFRKQSSPITEFVDEYCSFDPGKCIPTAMIYDAFSRWCKDQGAFVGSQCRFAQRFLLLYPGIHADRITFNGRQSRGFIGVTLTDEATERYLVRR